MIRNIEFRYVEDVYHDPDKELLYKQDIDRWLSPFTEEINHENVVVEYWINENGGGRLAFRNISPQLHRKIIEELSRFDH